MSEITLVINKLNGLREIKYWVKISGCFDLLSTRNLLIRHGEFVDVTW